MLNASSQTRRSWRWPEERSGCRPGDLRNIPSSDSLDHQEAARQSQGENLRTAAAASRTDRGQVTLRSPLQQETERSKMEGKRNAPETGSETSIDDEVRTRMIQFIKTHYAHVLGNDLELLDTPGGLETLHKKYCSHA